MEYTVNETIFKIVQAEITKVCADLDITNYAFYDEQTFQKTELDNDKITIVLVSNTGTCYFNSTVVPITLNVISTENEVAIAKVFADTFASEFTLVDPLITIENAYIQQAYSTPKIQSNFEEIDNGFRSLVSFNGTFVVAYNIDSVKNLNVDNETISVQALSIAFSCSPNPQPFYTSDSRTINMNKFGTFTINFAMENISSTFLTKVSNIVLGNASLNTTFNFNFLMGQTQITNIPLKLIDWKYKQNKGEVPITTLTFTR